MKPFKDYLWIVIIILLTVLGLSAGLVCLSMIKTEKVFAGTTFKNLDVGGLSLSEVSDRVTMYYRNQIEKGTLKIVTEKDTYSLPYADFDVTVDSDKVEKAVRDIMPKNGFEEFFIPPPSQVDIIPVYNYNSAKLIKMCETIFSAYEKQSLKGYYEIQNGKLVTVPDREGIQVDYKALEQELIARLTDNTPYNVDFKNTNIFKKVNAEHSLINVKMTEIVSTAEITLLSGTKDKAVASVKYIDNVLFEDKSELSLKSLVDFSQFKSDIDKDLLNRISTAVYQSFLPIDGIKVTSRAQSKSAVPYSQPGLEAVIEGEQTDLVVKNGTGQPLMLLADITNGTITVYIVSTGKLNCGSLVVEKKDIVPPPVIVSINRNLPENESKTLSEGVSGFTAHVSRVINGEKVELYDNKYQPVNKIIEAGERPASYSPK